MEQKSKLELIAMIYALVHEVADKAGNDYKIIKNHKNVVIYISNERLLAAPAVIVLDLHHSKFPIHAADTIARINSQLLHSRNPSDGLPIGR